MKQLTFILLFLCLSAFADSPKYDFEMTVTVNQKTLKEMQSIMKDFEEVAQKHGATLDVQIKQTNNEHIFYFNKGKTYIPMYDSTSAWISN